MKKGNIEADLITIQNISTDLNGVFTISDLQVILNTPNTATLHNRIKRLIKFNIITRFSRGLYVAKEYSRDLLSSKLEPDSYISLGTVLAKNGLVGTAPNQVSGVRVGRNREYKSEELVIKHYGISADLYFGFYVENGIKYADSEKAFLDTLYYHLRGHRYPFDPESDVDLDMLDHKRLEEYLLKYKNPKFVTFCKRILNG